MFFRGRIIALAGVVIVVVSVLGVGWLLWPEPPTVSDSSPPSEEPSVKVLATPAEPFITIGKSRAGRAITAYRFGNGAANLLFVGGIHGGYEWNSSLLAWQLIDHLTTHPEVIPPTVSVHVIPALNPDGLALAVGTGGRFASSDVFEPLTRLTSGRFNANGVDLNRNFDCNWAPQSTWRGQPVSAGKQPFSEPEAAALRDYVLTLKPVAVAFWHSQANAVYGAACNDGVLPLTKTLGERYAKAADYQWVPLFTAYPITGDVEGWLASVGIAAVTVELEGFQTTEWERNWAGVQSWLTYFATP